MGQNDVFNFLKKERRWVSIKEIVKHLKTNKGNVGMCLNKLYLQGEVIKTKKKTPPFRGNLWRIK